MSYKNFGKGVLFMGRRKVTGKGARVRHIVLNDYEFAKVKGLLEEIRNDKTCLAKADSQADEPVLIIDANGELQYLSEKPKGFISKLYAYLLKAKERVSLLFQNTTKEIKADDNVTVKDCVIDENDCDKTEEMIKEWHKVFSLREKLSNLQVIIPYAESKYYSISHGGRGHFRDFFADLLNVSPSYLYRKLSLLKLTQEWQEELFQLHICESVAYKISTLTKDEQERLLDICKENNSFPRTNNVRDYIFELKR